MASKRGIDIIGDSIYYTGLLTLENEPPKRRRLCNPILWRLIFDEVILELDKLFREHNLLNEMKELFRSQRIWKSRFNVVLDQLLYGYVYEGLMDDMDMEMRDVARVLNFMKDDGIPIGYMFA